MTPARKLPAGPRGIALVNLAVLLFGLAGVLGKLTGLPSPLIVLGRVVFAGVALLVAVCVLRLPIRARSTHHLAVLLAQGALLALHWTAFFQSINVSSVAIGLLSFSSFPLFTAALEPLVLKRRANALQIVAALFVLPGVVVLTPALSVANSTTAGVLWGVLAGATFALLSVTNRWLGQSYPSVVISLYQDGVATLVLLPTLLFVPLSGFASPRNLAILFILGVLCTALAHTLFIEGMRGVTAQLASLVAALEPVWGILFAFVLLREIPAGRTLVGGAIILAATLLPAVEQLCRRRTKARRERYRSGPYLPRSSSSP
jgi:drug/metabolite transporter (DMT)-like permease